MNNPNSNRPPLKFLSPMHRATRSIQVYLEADGRMELNNVEGHLLSFLLSYGPRPVGDLVRLTGLKKSTLTGILDRLEARGLLSRELNPDDRRSFLLRLSAAGKRAAERVRRVLEEFEAAVDAEVTAADRKGFERVMAAVARITEEENA